MRSPRDGRNITITEVNTALKNVLHFDGPLASNLANSLRPIVRKDGTFDLSDMRKHNVLEHDRVSPHNERQRGGISMADAIT